MQDSRSPKIGAIFKQIPPNNSIESSNWTYRFSHGNMLFPIAILFLQPQNGKPTTKYNVIMMAEPISDKIKQDLQAWLHLLEIEKDLEKNENYITAFTHPSYKGMFPKAEDYERYE
ncbi:MAG: hypothetical protein ACTSYI_08170, partial [Promethearchaeota archaeon]